MLRTVRNPAYKGVRTQMARHGGLPRDIVKKYGISSKAWSVYRSRHGGRKSRRNPESHSARSRAAKLGWRRRRRNPTGSPLSGASYRPRYKITHSGIRHGPKFAAVPQRRLLHRARTTVHRRRVRHNPGRDSKGRFRRSRRGAVGYSYRRSRSMSLSKTSAKGFLQKYVPLLSESSRHVVRTHKGYALIGTVGGLIVTSVVASSGGSVAGIIVTVGGGILLRVAARHGKGHASKMDALASGFVIGGLIAVALNIIASGSLTGTAKLGHTLPNLKRLAAKVRMSGLRGIGDATSQGLFGMPLTQLNGQLAKWGLPPVQIPALTGGRRSLGDYFNQETYNPVTEVGARSVGLARNAQGWGVPGSTGF